MNIEPNELTVSGVEDLRGAISRAYELVCLTLARIDNGIISPDEASAEIRELLTPLQISPAQTANPTNE